MMIDRNIITDILVIDDDDLTSELVERSLRDEPGQFRIIAAADGAEGLRQLRGGTPGSATRPMVVLLDINMPRMNGFEFLQAVRSKKNLRDSIIFVLTTSDDEEDRCRAYQKCVAGYIRKSDVGRGYCKLAQLISSFCDTVHLPS